MISVSLVNNIIRLTTFVFTFVQRISYAYYNWFKKQYGHFAKDFLDFTPKQVSIYENSSDPLLSETTEEDTEPAYVTIPFKTKTTPEIPQQNDFSTWSIKDAREIARSSNQGLISAKTESNLWLKIKEIAESQGKGSNESAITPNGTQVPKKISTKTTNFLSGTTMKLNEYQKKNQEYLIMKANNDSSVDNYSFAHPYAVSAFSRKTQLLLKSPRPRGSKKRRLPFRPTELSTIFESLGY
jgi:hypothetical protein